MSIRTAAAVAALTLLLGCPGDEPTPTEPELTRTEEVLLLTGSAADGGSNYATNCAGCHAADGTGGTGPDLTAAVPNLSDTQIVDSIIDGFPNDGMPSYATQSDQQIADLTAYLLAEWGSTM